jgi:hypothetical protein
MSFNIRASSAALLLAGVVLAGCAGDGSNIFTTGALGTAPATAAAPPEPRVDPACVTLASRIETMRREGIAEKIEKAAAKKYKMTHADLGKADQLTKVSAEFQLRCSTITPSIAAHSTSPMAAPPPPPPPAARPVAKAAPKAVSATHSTLPSQN